MADLALVFHDLVRLETALWNAVDARLRTQCGLTLAWFETMQYVGRSGPCRVTDIAEDLGIGWGGVSKIVDHVEAAGHCRRQPNPDDARSSLITLTPGGRRLLRDATVHFTAALQVHLAGALTGAQLEELSSTLTQLRRASTIRGG